jgi:hypothetical protein
MNDIVKEKKKKFILKILFVVSIIIVSIVALCTIFGTIDYFRVTSGKKPIFIYHTVNTSAFDVEIAGFENAALPSKEGATYYGIGYTVSICDSNTRKYTFQLGDKKTEPCYTSLTCTADKKGTLVVNDDSTVTYDENDIDNYFYSFFEGKLDKVMVTSIRPISSVENVETSSVKIKEFYDDIPGCAGMGKKISEEAYETVIACAIPKMSSDDIDKYLPIRTKELLKYTRDEVIAYHHNDLKCE